MEDNDAGSTSSAALPGVSVEGINAIAIVVLVLKEGRAGEGWGKV